VIRADDRLAGFMEGVVDRIGFRLGALVLLSCFSGCQAYQPTGGYYGNPLGPGAEIRVIQEISVPAGMARVYLQYGEPRAYVATDQYSPFCYFQMREPLPVVQVIRPGVFTVKSVSQIETEVSRIHPLMLASRTAFLGGDVGPVALQSHMIIAAEGQPDVRALVCSGAFDAPLRAQPIRLAEMREVLRGVAEIRATAMPQTAR